MESWMKRAMPRCYGYPQDDRLCDLCNVVQPELTRRCKQAHKKTTKKMSYEEAFELLKGIAFMAGVKSFFARSRAEWAKEEKKKKRRKTRRSRK